MPSRRNPCSYLPRRLQIVASLTVAVLFGILFLGGSSHSDPYLARVPLGEKIEHGAHEVLEHVPFASQLNPFGQPVHRPPPDQKNSSSGDVKWYSDFKWRNPFSSSTTLDEERAVLPPLRDRPPVYTYFDPTGRRKDQKSRQAEQDLLEIWRRAWWAQGFKPVVLGRPEATNNPLFRRIQDLYLTREMDLEIMRWLAWGDMGSGILCNWLALPMAQYDDPLLSYLRRGEYPHLTRYQNLENALFSGTKQDIDRAILAAIDSPAFGLARSLYEAVPEGTFLVDPDHQGIAFYSISSIGEKYAPIKKLLDDEQTRSSGMAMLPPLINSHLHATWQSTFSSGIAVLKPIAQNTTAMISPAIELARNLSQCSDSPMPSSCPPNVAHCMPCVASQAMRIYTPAVFQNKTTVFTIGTVPHPWTLQSLIHSNPDLDLPFIRRKTSRDVWITAATKELLGTGVSAFARLAPIKEAVVSEFSEAHSYWFTAESALRAPSAKELEELDWIFGFQIPRVPMPNGKSETPVPGPERRPPPPKQEYEGKAPTADTLSMQHRLVEKGAARLHGVGKPGKDGKTGPDPAIARIRTIIEAWNIADTEVWKFVRAYNTRQRLERRAWEQEENRFLGKGMYERFKDFVSA